MRNCIHCGKDMGPADFNTADTHCSEECWQAHQPRLDLLWCLAMGHVGGMLVEELTEDTE